MNKIKNNQKLESAETIDIAEACLDCVIPAVRVVHPNNGMCVTCPFCKKLVNAIVTAKQICCPACKASVAITP